MHRQNLGETLAAAHAIGELQMRIAPAEQSERMRAARRGQRGGFC